MRPAKRWLCDLETHSEAELSDIGSYAYAMHPTTDVLTGSWVELDASDLPIGPFFEWRSGDAPPTDFLPHDRMIAYNATFDSLITEHVLTPRYGWPAIAPEQWECLMVRSYYGNFPGKLEKLAEVLAAGEKKDMEGHRLMMKLARPARPVKHSDDPRRHHDLASLNRLMEYNVQDVKAEAALVPRLPRLPAAVTKMVDIDRIINRRGILVDLKLVDDLQWCADAWKETLRASLVKLTRGAVEKETAKKSSVQWLREQGLAVHDGKGGFDKLAKDALLADPNLPEQAREFLLLSRELSKTSLAKLPTIRGAVCPDGRLRGMFQVYGAHQTGRWGGRVIQPQNLPKGIISGKNHEETTRNYDDVLWAVRQRDLTLLHMLFDQGPGQPSQVLDALASLIRCCLIPRPGYKFIVADFNAIEPRTLAWMAGARKLLDVYSKNGDPYVTTAASTLRVPEAQVTKKQRNDFGKPTVIGGGYGLGPTRLKAYAWDNFKAVLTDAECQLCIQGYRKTYPEIPAFWRGIETAAKTAVGRPGTVQQFRMFHFKMVGSALMLHLPSGRCLRYNGARLVTGLYGPVIEFDYEDGMTHQWTSGTIWGGAFTENVDQAICTDFLGNGLVLMENEGMAPVFHAHDEVMGEVPEDGPDHHDLEKLICQFPAWANGLPVKAEGYSSRFYRK